MIKFPAVAPIIYLITEGAATNRNFRQKSVEILKLVEIAVSAKISFIQIREKKIPARFVFELTQKAAQITRNSPTKLLVNDRADIARLAGADGVHLTAGSLPAEVIRRDYPKDFLIGVSTHTLAEAKSAKRQGADFVSFGSIFHTPNKGEPKGLEALREICEQLKPFPVIALGGIDESNYGKVLESGARGFAAIRFLNNTGNLEKLARELNGESQRRKGARE